MADVTEISATQMYQGATAALLLVRPTASDGAAEMEGAILLYRSALTDAAFA